MEGKLEANHTDLSVSRRFIIRGCSVGLVGSLAGCSGGPLVTSDSGNPQQPESAGLSIENSTERSQTVSILVLEKDRSPDSDRSPRTVTGEPPTDPNTPVIQDRIQIDGGGSKYYQGAFQVPEKPLEYRLYVDVEAGASTAYAFDDHELSSLSILEVDIVSDSEINVAMIVE